MNYKSESTITQTHKFSEQEISKGKDGTFIVTAVFTKQNLIELAQYKEFKLILEIPFQQEER
jgi:hypothetical protein